MKRYDFERIRNSGKFLSFPYFSINFAEGKGQLGVIVSKKISMEAVTRNKIRRQIKEALRINKLLDNEHDYVIIVKPAITHLNYGKISTELKNAFTNL